MELRGKKSASFLTPALILTCGGFANLVICLLTVAGFFKTLSEYNRANAGQEMEYLNYMYAPASLVVLGLLSLGYAVSGIYALSAAGLLKWKPPFLKFVIYATAITSIYSGLVFFDNYSIMILIIGILYLVGGWGVFNGIRK